MKYQEILLALSYYYGDGLEIKNIAKTLGVAKGTVYKWVGDLDNTYRLIRKHDLVDERIPVVLEYRAKGYSFARIGKILKIRPQAVHDILIKYTVRQNRKCFPDIDNLDRQSKIKLAKELRADAYSFRDIATQILDIGIAQKVTHTFKVSKDVNKAIDRIRNLKIGDGTRETIRLKNIEALKHRDSLVSKPFYRDGAKTIFIAKKFNIDSFKSTLSCMFNSVTHACRCINFLKKVHGISDKGVVLSLTVRHGSVKRECVKYWGDRLPMDKPKIKVSFSNQVNDPGIPRYGKLRISASKGSQSDIRDSVAYAIESYGFEKEPWIIGRRELGKVLNKTSQLIYTMVNDGWLRHYYSGAGAYLYFRPENVIQDINDYHIKKDVWDLSKIV